MLLLIIEILYLLYFVFVKPSIFIVVIFIVNCHFLMQTHFRKL